MDMQDKNIDEIFRLKLEAFEMEPSESVWPRIAYEMDPVKRKRSLAPYYGVAASVIILVSAGIFFIPQKAKINGERHSVNNIAKTVTKSSPNKSENVLPDQSNSTTPKQSSIAVHHYKAANLNPVQKISPEIKTLDSGKTGQPIIASVTQREQERIEAAVPDMATQLSVTQPAAETTGFINKPSLAAAQLPYADRQNDGFAKPRHTIRSLGGLINAVVAKIDKRRDKIIEFTDDDDETNVTGINLGIIKIKKEK